MVVFDRRLIVIGICGLAPAGCSVGSPAHGRSVNAPTRVEPVTCSAGGGAVVEHAGLLARLVDPVLRRARTVGGLVTAVVASCIGANIVTSDQYIAIVLPGRMFRAEFERRGFAPVVLSRAVGDSATVTSPLVPWNSCGAYMAATLGVATLSFAGFAFFCLVNPLVTILIAVAGLRMVRLPTAKPAGAANL